MIILLFNLIFCNSYESNTTEKINRAIVINIHNDSIRTYLHEVGYLEWKITKTVFETHEPKTNEILSGEYYLESQFGHSILYVTPSELIQYAYFKIDGHEFKYNIRYGRKIYRKGHKEGSNKRIYSGEYLTGEHITPRRYTVGKLQEIFITK